MIALVENHGYVLSSLTVAPVNEADMVLLLRACVFVSDRVFVSDSE